MILLWSLALTLLAAAVHSSSEEGSSSAPSYDLSGAELTRLYNSPVFMAEKMKRPLLGFLSLFGYHSGVRVTLADGSQWLIQKGNNYGRSYNTVVTSSRHMSSNWTVDERRDFQGRKTVADFVAAGGSNYNLIFDNCHDGSRRMMNQ